MWALLAAIVAVSIALAVVGAARRELLAKAESTEPPCCCEPCRHTCQRRHP